MEHHTISRHEVALYNAMKESEGWHTVHEWAALSGIASRTANRHCARLTQLGILDQMNLFPGYRYRLSTFAEERNRAYVQKLDKAVEVIGQSSRSN